MPLYATRRRFGPAITYQGGWRNRIARRQFYCVNKSLPVVLDFSIWRRLLRALVITAALAWCIPASATPVVQGFDQASLPRADDVVSGAVPLGFRVAFYGATYDSVYVSNNGTISFAAPQIDFTPYGLGAAYTGQPIIAPFFADVDTRPVRSGVIRYGTGLDAGRAAFGVTWPGVGYFQLGSDRLNAFQLILTDRSDRGAGDFDIIFNYGSIEWEAGYANGGVDGLGGTTASAGWHAGDAFFAMPGSLVPGAFLDGGVDALATSSNDGTPGQFRFAVQNGSVAVPEPASAWLLLTALIGLQKRHRVHVHVHA